MVDVFNFGAFSIFAIIMGILSSALSVFIAAHIVRYVFRDVIKKFLES